MHFTDTLHVAMLPCGPLPQFICIWIAKLSKGVWPTQNLLSNVAVNTLKIDWVDIRTHANDSHQKILN